MRIGSSFEILECEYGFYDFVIIIAVMQLRRQPYLRKFKKDNEAAVAKKIKELQLAAEQQKNQVRSLLGEESNRHTQASLPDNQPTVSARTTKIETSQTTPTARRKFNCQDYLQRQNEPPLQERRHLQNEGEHKPPLPMIVIPGKEEDKEIEYLKSDQYKKYLEKLMQAHSKSDKAKVIKQNRNNNVYLGKTTDRKQYLQEIIRTKEVLPRVNLQFIRDEADTKSQKQLPQYRGQLVDSYFFNDNFVSKQGKKGGIGINKKSIEQESPIKYAEQSVQMRSNNQKQSNNVTIILSPVCQHQEKSQPPSKEIKDVTLYYHNQKSSRQPENAKPNDKIDNKIETSSKSKPIRIIETCRNEMEYCPKVNNQTQRCKVGQKQRAKKPPQMKITYQNKQNYSIQSQSSRSFSQSPSFPGKQSPQRSVYDVSFKIDKPPHTNRQHWPRQPTDHRPVVDRRSPSPNPTPNSSPFYCPHDWPPITKHSQPGQKAFAQHTYSHPHRPWPLQCSQTNSAATREDNHSHSKSGHKISVISRSKHRK